MVHKEPKSHLVDLLDVNLGAEVNSGAGVDAWGMPQPPRPQVTAL